MKYNYEKGLLDYNGHSSEKIDLARAVGNIIGEDVRSLFDVGAGEGTFASMIAPQVPRYVAVEKRGKNVSALRDRGLEVIEGDFPFETKEKFDMVLASHSVPNEKMDLEPFVESLVHAAKEQGVVCVITYRTDKDAWYELMRSAMNENWHAKNYDTYEMLFDVLKQYGNVTVEKVDTTVRGKNPRELFAALRFIYAGKDPELASRFNQYRKEILSWLSDTCKTEQGYEFPFFQYVVTLKKDGTGTPATSAATKGVESVDADPWARLINHERHELKFGDISVVVEDQVFTPDPEITYSTSMILENLPSLERKRVIDIGTGTGVIAITAAKHGADEVIANDIADSAVENARENIARNKVGDTVKVVKTNLLENIDGTFDYIFANIPILDEVWDPRGIEVKSTVQKLLESAQSRLNHGGKIYIPWGSFAEAERSSFESQIVQNGYTFELKSKEALGFTWYLYVLSREK